MTQRERDLFEKLGHCYNDFIGLDQLHQADNRDFEFHIHALQNIVLSRDGMRNYWVESQQSERGHSTNDKVKGK